MLLLTLLSDWFLGSQPDDHHFEWNFHWGGILLVAVGVFMLCGTATTHHDRLQKSRWDRMHDSKGHPATGIERLVAIAVCFTAGIYLICRS